MRIDGLMAKQNQNISMIYLTEKKRQITLNHVKRIYSDSVLDEEQLKQYMDMTRAAEKVKVVGNEKISGYKCTIKETWQTFKMMGMTMNMKMVTWVSDKFDMPLRTKTEDGTITELRNIKKTKPKAALFKIPKGYKKVGSMMEVTGMDMPSKMPGATSGGSSGTTAMPEGMNLDDALKNLQDALKNMPTQ